tara:strand:- start:455 stop:811 length:357 start_codon:yes stop_codon:yes gene_type:complete
MNTLRSIMEKVEALTNEVALLRAKNKALATEVKAINDKPVAVPIKAIRQLSELDVDELVAKKMASIEPKKHITADDVAVIVGDKISNIKRQDTLTSDDVILDIKNVVNLDYINKLYGK